MNGQKKNVILNILDEFGDRVPSANISLKKANNQKSENRNVRINDNLDSDVTIHVKDPNITLVIKSFNGTTVEIPGTHIVKIEITEDNENYQLIKGESAKKVIINKLKKYLGSVIATGPTKRIQALTRGTIFSLSLNGNDLNIALREGKLNLDHLIKREIKDNNAIGNDSIRSLFIRQKNQLVVKDGTYPNINDSFNNNTLLSNDKEIKKLLRKPFNLQKRALINKGVFSKIAVKEIENEDATEKAILSFKKALKNTELEIDLIIQSTLLFSDYYLYNENFEKSRNWLEVGLYFSKISYDLKNDHLNHFVDNNSNENTEIDDALTNAIRFDMLTANQFFAWGYDIKLRLNNCLENETEDPSKYRSKAKELLKEIDENN